MDNKSGHEQGFEWFEKPYLQFFSISWSLNCFCVGAQKKLVYAGNQLQQTFAMGAGWDLLVIQALKPCALRLEDQIMWCSTNQPMPDSHSVERYLASKENRTCHVVGMMSSNIEN